MSHVFDDGLGREPFATLVREYPDASVYPPAAFRVEWGPIFHRGRLDGSARLLAIGQDPAQHETIARRILVGEAGQRAQGFLAKLGFDRSYVMVNTFLYSVYGQVGGAAHVADPEIVAYRNRWLDALLLGSRIEAVVAFGALADDAWTRWSRGHPRRAARLAYEHVTHPTQPESTSGGDRAKRAAAIAAMLENWNGALGRLHPRVTPDDARPLVLYGDAFAAGDDVEIPEGDLPAGMPPWMRALASWAERTGPTSDDRRATITVRVPSAARPWSHAEPAEIGAIRQVD